MPSVMKFPVLGRISRWKREKRSKHIAQIPRHFRPLLFEVNGPNDPQSSTCLDPPTSGSAHVWFRSRLDPRMSGSAARVSGHCNHQSYDCIDDGQACYKNSTKASEIKRRITKKNLLTRTFIISSCKNENKRANFYV
ncbi:hypothetical protein L596_013302 [Steinernema carpocapsae]|uniref:Uncharacterized protein n=1 Tax=Steinernema carpocapsae TaxID=34508 RepID=A0A4U5NZS9_STECR|nr:hypothetical protein L596_013302 [Steinernema carpocapsae]